MSEAIERLRHDLTILEAMASEMDDYLRSQTLFWPMLKGNLPRLTVGGYLMRQHRLLALRHLLDEDEAGRLDAAIDQFNEALVEKVVRFEERAHEELHARLRQWGEYLKEVGRESLAMGDYYSSHVQTRAMISALLDKLEMPPYKLDTRVLDQLGVYDRLLRNYWESGEFIWPTGWQEAYPKRDYWWLYGQPRHRSDS